MKHDTTSSSPPTMQQFHRLLDAARSVVVLTGAGVSAESGVPTFRGSAGLWRRMDPAMLATPQAFVRSPSQVWEFYSWRRDVVARCRPNPAHYALAAFQARCDEAHEEGGRRFTLITQNVDRLHQAAGSRDVIELHGSIWDVCVATRGGYRDDAAGAPYEDRRQPVVPALAGAGAPDVAPGAAPEIPVEQLPHDARGRLLRPGVVWFNEALDEAVAERAADTLDRCDLLLIVGTSSTVYPAAGYAPQVALKGVPVVEFNLEPTDNTRVVRLAFHGRAGELLPAALRVEDAVRDIMAAVAVS